MEGKEAEISKVKMLSKLAMEKEFLLNVLALPPYIGKPELEVFYLLLKARQDHFLGVTDAYNHLYKEHLSQPKEKRPRYNKARDKKYYIGKGKIMSKLQDAGLIKQEYDEKSKRKTWRLKITLHWNNTIITPEKAEKQGIKPNSLITQSIYEWTDEQLITGLEGYVYHNNPRIELEAEEIFLLKKMSIEELEGVTNDIITVLDMRQKTTTEV